jgi:hypothetical protein
MDFQHRIHVLVLNILITNPVQWYIFFAKCQHIDRPPNFLSLRNGNWESGIWWAIFAYSLFPKRTGWWTVPFTVERTGGYLHPYTNQIFLCIACHPLAEHGTYWSMHYQNWCFVSQSSDILVPDHKCILLVDFFGRRPKSSLKSGCL